MVVTKLEAVTKNKYKVYLDGQFAFVLYKGELTRYHIQEGNQLEDEVRKEIWQNIILKRVRSRALHLLEDMDRTESGLREKLKQGLYPEEAIDAAVLYVKSYHYIDDFRYAKHFIESRKAVKSKREIYALLCRKGVAADQIELAFEEAYEADGEREAIYQIIKKKRFNLTYASEGEMQKIYAYLSRKGFRYDDIRQVIQNYNENA
jgi:regulatory protein